MGGFAKCGAVCAAMLLVSTTAWSQGSTGTITGTVSDATGGVIPGAAVTVANTDTGVRRAANADSTGRYHFPGLIPGPYEVQAQSPGFQTEIRKGVQLTVGSELAIDMQLSVGQIEQVTIVTAEAPLVETVTNTISSLVNEQAIRDLPLNGRSFDQLISLQSAAPMITARGRTSLTGQGNVFSVSGARTQSNQYLMDGTEVVGAGSITTQPGGVLGKNMGVEAIQEFTVLTSNYSAAYGKRSGGVVNIATRSGTNQLHGSAFEFHRNDNLDARNFFDGEAAPEFKRNQFGGALGGPIVRDKSFFFGTYEALRESLGLTNIAKVPDDNARRGCLPGGTQGAGCPAGHRRVEINPAVSPFLVLFPPANGVNFGDGSAESESSPNQPSRQDFFLVRVDHRFSEKDAIFGRYNFSDADVVDPTPNPYFASFDNNRDQMATFDYKRTFPTLLNSARIGFTRSFVYADSLPVIDIDPALRFLPNAKTVGNLTFSTSTAGAPLSDFGTATGAERFFVVNQFDYQDQVFYYSGPHSLQFGAQVQRIQHNENFQNSLRGAFQFSDFESFLLARPTLFRAPDPSGGGDAEKAYRMIFFSAFFQDDYKLRPHLTLNLGVRYELMSVPVEARGDRIANFQIHNVNGERLVDSSPTLGSPFFQSHHKTIAPRVGFAWDISGNGVTAVRGGYGMFYDQIESEFRFFTPNNTPYFGLTDVTSNPAAGAYAPFPLGFSAGSGALRAPQPDGIDFNIDVPTRLHWNLGIQRQITANTVFNANYVGSHSYHLTRNSDANTRRPVILSDGRKQYVGGSRKNPALAGSRIVTSDVNAAYHSIQLDFNQRLSHGFRSKLSFTYAKSIDDASVTISQHALGGAQSTQDPDQAKGDRGLSAYDLRRNLVANFNYDVPSSPWTGPAQMILGGWQLGMILTLQDGTPFTALTGFSRSADQARSIADRPDLPAGAEKNPVEGVTAGCGPAGPDGQTRIRAGQQLGGSDRYYDPCVFALQPAGFYGNLGRNTLIAPGLFTLDFNLGRDARLTETFRIEFRAEMFNLLNRANFGLPDNNVFETAAASQAVGVPRGGAGRINSTTSTSRQIQFGLKLIF